MSYLINSIRMAKIGLCYLKMDFSKFLDSKYLIFMKTMASKYFIKISVNRDRSLLHHIY